MKTKRLIIYFSVGFLLLIFFSGCKNNIKSSNSESRVASKEELIKRGSYLVSSIGCSANVGSWGVSFGANITSDASGIGNWPEENFIRAMKRGKYKGIEGARTLLPPMPWADFSNLTDDDVIAIHAFLITTKPVRNIVPAAIAP